MRTAKIDPLKHIQAFGIQCQPLSVHQGFSKQAINTTHCIVSPGQKTTEHKHREVEQFYILSGQGVIHLEEKTIPVEEGQLFTIPPFTHHIIYNPSTTQELVFLSSYSDFVEVEQIQPYQSILAAPPTPNGDLHLGHLGGPYLASDTYRRYLQMRNADVTSLSGTDDYQNYVLRKAKELGKPVRETLSVYRDSIVNAFQSADVHFDGFFYPSEDTNYKFFVSSFVSQLLERGVFTHQQVSTFYEKKSQKVVLESEVQGQCPECHDLMVGSGCESCGFVGDVSLLLDPVHIRGEELEIKKISRWVLKWRDFDLQIDSILAQSNLDSLVVSHFKNLVKQIDFYPVSYPGEWGVPIDETQVINVWVEMAASYAYRSQTVGRPFFNGRDSSSTLFCGEDNLFYYLILIPLLLKLYDSELTHPYHIQMNPFFLLEGEKFSTSRQHAIWAKDYLSHQDSDYLRYYLALKRPTVRAEDMDLEKMPEVLKVLKIDQLDSLIEFTRDLNLEGTISDLIIRSLSERIVNYERHFASSDLGFRENALLISSVVSMAVDLKNQVLKGDLQNSNLILVMRVLALFMVPFFPKRSSLLLSYFNDLPRDRWITDLSVNLSQELVQAKRGKQ